MTEVLFYHLEHQPLERVLPSLVEKTLERGWRAVVQAGGGIVADSVPESEWQETQNKARAVLRAAEMALAGLDTPTE